MAIDNVRSLVPPNQQPLPDLDAAPPLAGSDSKTEVVDTASQWQLIWWRFRKHKMAMVSAGILAILYITTLFCEFIATYDPNRYEAELTYAPPQRIHFIDEAGNFHLRPFAYPWESVRDPDTMRMVFEPDTTTMLPIYLFIKGEPYKMWAIWEMDRHLFGVKLEDGFFYLFGADRLGRDMYSRIVYGTRISMSVGMIGIFISLILGLLLGGISGYYGGTVDTIIQRLIEFMRSIPTIPLWMGLSAAVPKEWSPLRMYFTMTILLSLLAWTGSGTRGARALSCLAQRRLRHCCHTDWRKRDASDFSPYGPFIHESYHRFAHTERPRRHPGRNSTEFPRTGPAPSRD